jgi:hypothetical protein
VAKFFEEIKVLVRDVPERVAGELGTDHNMQRMRMRRRFHPMMFEELLHHPMLRESADAAGLPILMVFGMLRDDFPWLYELGVQMYRASQDGDPRVIERARRALTTAVEITESSSFMQEMMGGPDDDQAMIFIRHFVSSIDRFILKGRRARKPESQPDDKGK